MFPSEEIKLNLPQAHLVYYPHFFEGALAKHYFDLLLKTIPWKQDDITLFGKTHKQPRLTAFFSDAKKSYSYSNILMHPNTFNKELLAIKNKIETKSQIKFNSCLANLYRNGQDSNGWHADNEKELGKNPIIASLTLGEERFFHLKHRKDKNLKQKILLQNGSLLIMKGETQHHWLHQIAKTKKQIAPRINLTFRIIY